MSTEVAYGILAPVVAKAGHEAALTEFLNTGYDLSLAEPDTAHWFALKYTDGDSPSSSAPTTFAIFDTFATTAARAAHLGGPIAAALMANAPVLLDGAPEIGEVEVLASSISPVGEGAGRTKGLSVGLVVLFEAQGEGKVQELKDLLVGARELILAEPETLVWYAFWYPGTNKFGIVDFFPSEQGRVAHLAGKVAAALLGSVGTLVTAPKIIKVDVIAAKV